MTGLSAWILDWEDDGTYTLIAPNGERLFTVSLHTLKILSEMFLNEVESAAELDDLREALYG